MSGVNVQVYLGAAEWPEIDTAFPVTLTFAESVRITLGGKRMEERAEWLRLVAQRLLNAAEAVDAAVGQSKSDMAATEAEIARLRGGSS